MLITKKQTLESRELITYDSTLMIKIATQEDQKINLITLSHGNLLFRPLLPHSPNKFIAKQDRRESRYFISV